MNTIDRRDFLKISACAAAGAALPGRGADLPKLGDIRADDVMGKLVKTCRQVIAPERLLGFLMAPWECLKDDEAYRLNVRAIDIFADAMRQA